MRYDPHAVEAIAGRMDLREPNRAALDALARALANAEDGAEIVAELATGVGKTYVAGGLLDYLHEAGVRDVVIITPGSTIQRKTIENLTPGRPKYLQGMTSRPVVITVDDVCTGAVGQALRDRDAFRVFVLTVQSLIRPETRDNRRAHRPHEALGASLSDHLRACEGLVVIADEHHVYFSGSANRFRAAVTDLSPRATVGLTATPHASTPADRIAVRYPLADAITDGYVKVPVLVARPDGRSDRRTQLQDGVALLAAKAAAMREYCAQTHRPHVEPVMFVVAAGIEDATRIRDLLAGPDLFGTPDRVLLVTSEEPDESLRLLDGIEDPASPVRAVVSVSMLKEGWDVKNIYVIASARSMESRLLSEQVLGRGLRLPFGHRTGVEALDTVELLAHHAFADLLERAHTMLDGTAVTVPGIGGDDVPVGLAALPDRLAAAAAPVIARRPDGADRPPATMTWTREPLSLADLDPADVEALGAGFAEPGLRRQALHGGLDEQQQLQQEPQQQDDADDLAARLLLSDEVPATASQARLALTLARAFAAGAAGTPWTARSAAETVLERLRATAGPARRSASRR